MSSPPKKSKLPSEANQNQQISIRPLPDVPTIAVLDNLPLEDLWTQVPNVSDQWLALHSETLRKRTHLTLFINSPEECANKVINDSVPPFEIFLPTDSALKLPGTAHSRLSFPRLGHQTTSSLLDFFTEIKTLEVVQKIPSTSFLNPISFIINHWKAKLTTVRIWTWLEPSAHLPSTLKVSHYRWFFKSINECTKLKHFTFYVDDHFLELPNPLVRPQKNLFVVNTPIRFNFLSGLETLQFSTSENPTKLLVYLEGQKQFPVLQIGNSIEFSDDFHPELTPECFKQFQSLSFKIIQSSYLNHVYNATNLRHLSIEFTRTCRVREFLANLQEMKQLTYLKMTLSRSLKSFITEEDKQRKLEDLPQCPSIRALILHFTATTHEAFASCHLGHIFPGIEKVDLVHYLRSCSTCKYDDVYEASPSSLLPECINKLMADWKEQCPTVKYIRLRPNDAAVTTKNEQIIKYSSLIDQIEYVQ